MKKIALILSLALVSLGLSRPELLHANQKYQVIEKDLLRDKQNGFELRRPNDDWDFLLEKTIRRFDVNAAAGLFHKPSRTYTLVARRPGGGSLAAYLRRLPREMRLTRTRVAEQKVVTTQGQEVGRLRLQAYKEGELRTYKITVVPRDRTFYRVVSWWPGRAKSAVGADLDRIHGDFDVIGSSEFVRKFTSDPYDMVGVGWEVRDNFYQNPILGISAALPREDWRFLGSNELRELNPEAAMGMEHVDGAYLILVAEKLGAYVWEGYEENVVKSLKEEMRFGDHQAEPVTLMNQKRNLHLFKRAKVDGRWSRVDYGVVVSTAETYGFQWFAWWPSGDRKEAVAALKQVYSNFSYMDWARQKRLRNSLMGFAGRPRSVQGNENYRNLTYRNLDTGTTLRLPRGFWDHRLLENAGEEQSTDETEAASPDAEFENVTNGLYVTVKHASCRLKARAFHQDVVKSFGEHTLLKRQTIGRPYGPIYSTRLLPDDDRDFIYHVATAVRGEKCLTMTMSGYERNLKRTLALENLVLRGLSMSGRSQPAFRNQAAEFVDNRMGFRLRKPAGWSFNRLRPEDEIRATSLLSGNSGKVSVLAGAIQSAVEGRDLPGDFDDVEFLRGLDLNEPDSTTVKWLGQDSQRLVFRGSRGGEPVSVELLITGIGGTSFFILAVGDGEGTTVPAALRGGFRLMR